MVTYNLNGIPEEERMFDDEDEDITTVFDFYTFTSKEDFNTWYGDYGRGPQPKPVSYTYVSISEVRNRVWNQQYNEFVTYTHIITVFQQVCHNQMKERKYTNGLFNKGIIINLNEKIQVSFGRVGPRNCVKQVLIWIRRRLNSK